MRLSIAREPGLSPGGGANFAPDLGGRPLLHSSRIGFDSATGAPTWACPYGLTAAALQAVVSRFDSEQVHHFAAVAEVVQRSPEEREQVRSTRTGGTRPVALDGDGPRAGCNPVALAGLLGSTPRRCPNFGETLVAGEGESCLVRGWAKFARRRSEILLDA